MSDSSAHSSLTSETASDYLSAFTAGSLARGAKVLIFGGNGNIGQSVCRLLASEGADIAFTYFSNIASAQAVAESLSKCYMLQCDTRDAAQVLACVREARQKLGGLNAIIQCSGVCGEVEIYQRIASNQVATILDITLEQVQRMWQAHSLSAFNICKAATDVMLENGGSIVLLGSMVCCKAVTTPIHFSMSKTAMVGLVESLSKDVGPANILVNIIAPGLVEGGASNAVTESLKQTYRKFCALKRLALPDEIAQVALWMALHNNYVTGQCILLDGGL